MQESKILQVMKTEVGMVISIVTITLSILVPYFSIITKMAVTDLTLATINSKTNDILKGQNSLIKQTNQNTLNIAVVASHDGVTLNQ